MHGADAPHAQLAYEDLSRLHHAPGHPLRTPLLRAELVRLLGSLYEVGSTRSGEGWPLNLARALEYLNRHHPRADLTIPEVARAAHISPTTLRRLCYNHLARSPIAYLSTLRIHRARDLLERTDLSIKEIALRVGFADPLYFSRLYRRIYGHAPSQEGLRAESTHRPG